MAKLTVWAGLCALALGAACGAQQRGAGPASSGAPSGVSAERLSAETDAPALFLGPERDAPVVGFLGRDVHVEVAGPSEQGRVPVRIRGSLWVRGYVPEELLVLRTQRPGRLRGTPVYLGPNDAVNVVGPGEKAGRLRVRATPRVPGYDLAAYEGTYPAAGLAAQVAVNAPALVPGEPQVLLVNTALPLYDKPGGKKLAELPPQRAMVHVRVLSRSQGWAAVRVGEGPYLVGYTNANMVPSPEAAPAPAAGPANSALPRRLAKENGELKRVVAGARVSFGARVIARLHDAGVARVLSTYPSGEVDALVAVNEEVTVRGLVRAADLSAYAAP